MTRSLFLHGFGARYDLPISLSLYLFAGAAVVVLSFIIVVSLAGGRIGSDAVHYTRWRVAALDGLVRSRWPRIVGGLIGVLVLVAVVVTGLAGSSNPARNPATYLVWIYFWAALVILTGLVGNIWQLVNPWTALFDALPVSLRSRPPGRLPDWLRTWPAVVVFLAFVWLELASGLSAQPRTLGVLAVAYSLLTLAGMAVFGRDAWLARCEAFTVLLGIVSRLAPVEVDTDELGRRRLWLRVWGTGLLQQTASGWDRIVFVIIMLSSLAFDGILATPAWRSLDAQASGLLAPLGPAGQTVERTAGLLVLTAAFLAVFTAVMWLVLHFGGARKDTSPADRLAILTAFAFTLVPIALVYNAAHNYSYVVVQAQALVPLLADPLGRGWSLLPTAGYRPSFALASAATVWYIQVVLIVLGHVVAVYLAHLRAGQRFRTAYRVLQSQYPMLGLMVLYTMTSLWILAQPTTRGA
jgi:hypothetical protein